MSVINSEQVNWPLVPVIVAWKLIAVRMGLTVNVSVLGALAEAEAGENEAVTPAGSADMERAADELKPFEPVNEIVNLPVDP